MARTGYSSFGGAGHLGFDLLLFFEDFLSDGTVCWMGATGSWLLGLANSNKQVDEKLIGVKL
jgi:hypothetical protein